MSAPERSRIVNGQPGHEEWRPVPGYEGLYQVSDRGNVHSLGRWTTSRGHTKPHWYPPRMMRLCKSGKAPGHLAVNLHRGGTHKRIYVHVLVSLAFHGPKPTDKHEVRHLNGDSFDNRAQNLKWGTHRENILDKFVHGTDHNVNKTHCVNGHEFTPENTFLQPKPKRRVCKICRRNGGAKHRENRRLEARERAA